VSKVKEGWVGSSILVVGEHQASIIMHALANKAAKKKTDKHLVQSYYGN
jgi:hypothetical protein